MSVFASVGILLFSMLIMAFLQFVPGIFAIFRHNLAGKFSELKTSDSALFFILGLETALVLFLFILYFIFNCAPIFDFVSSDFFAWILAGILAALGILLFCFYFQPGKGTKLFVSRRAAESFREKSRVVKSRSDAFTFGFVSFIPELGFTLPVFIVFVLTLLTLDLSATGRAALILLFSLFAVLPLFIITSLMNSSATLADFIRFRFKHKLFFRIFLTLFYFALTLLIILGVLL